MPNTSGKQRALSSGSGGPINQQFRIRVEGRFELEQTDASHSDAQLAAELNGISTQIDQLIASEIESHLPSTVTVDRVSTSFGAGSLTLDSVVSLIGPVGELLVIADYAVKMTRWVFEHLPKDLRDANLAGVPQVKSAEVWAGAIDQIVSQPPSGNQNGINNSQITLGRVLQIVILMLASAILLLVVMMVVLVVRYGLF